MVLNQMSVQGHHYKLFQQQLKLPKDDRTKVVKLGDKLIQKMIGVKWSKFPLQQFNYNLIATAN